MESIADRYNRLADAFAATIAAVPPDKWDAQSPCPDWKARDVVRHVCETPGLFFKFVDREYGDLPDDPAEAFAAARARVSEALADPKVADAVYEGQMGRMSFAEGIDRFINIDLLVHRWDLATAAGLETTIDDADLDRIEAACERFGDAMRSPRAFGPAVEPPPGADRQTRLLAFLGRAA